MEIKQVPTLPSTTDPIIGVVFVKPEFDLLGDSCRVSFIRRVNDRLEEGWRLHGVINYKNLSGGILIYEQAMTKGIL